MDPALVKYNSASARLLSYTLPTSAAQAVAFVLCVPSLLLSGRLEDGMGRG